MDGEDMKKIPLKNYILLFVILLITIGIMLYLVKIYNSKKEYENTTNVRMNFLKEITADDFENYIKENPEIILYISNSDNKSFEELEKSLKKNLVKKEYVSDMIYLNAKNASSNFADILTNYYSPSLKLITYSSIPNILLIQEGTITKVFYITDSTTKDDVIEFIEQFYD